MFDEQIPLNNYGSVKIIYVNNVPLSTSIDEQRLRALFGALQTNIWRTTTKTVFGETTDKLSQHERPLKNIW